MRMFEAWRQHLILGRSQGGRAERLAFQAGARFALNELAEHIEPTEQSAQVANRVNDEIRDFGTVALRSA